MDQNATRAMEVSHVFDAALAKLEHRDSHRAHAHSSLSNRYDAAPGLGQHLMGRDPQPRRRPSRTLFRVVRLSRCRSAAGFPPGGIAPHVPGNSPEGRWESWGSVSEHGLPRGEKRPSWSEFDAGMGASPTCVSLGDTVPSVTRAFDRSSPAHMFFSSLKYLSQSPSPNMWHLHASFFGQLAGSHMSTGFRKRAWDGRQQPDRVLTGTTPLPAICARYALAASRCSCCQAACR